MQILTALLDRGLDIQWACDASRSFPIEGSLTHEHDRSSVAEDLARRGHRIAWADEPLGACNAIYIDHARDVMFGASDHGKDGIALGF